MAKDRGLGRGFDALLPTELDVSDAVRLPSGDSIRQVNPSVIRPNPHQPRKNFDESQLQGLADSIRHHGILQPLVVSDLGNGKYELIAGERRLRASKIAGLREVPVILRSFDEQQKLELALIENLQRQELNAIETAIAYRRLADEFGLTQSQISQRVGQALSTVANIMRLINLPIEVQQMVITGILSEAHARQVLAVDGREKQLEVAKMMVENKWTTRQAEEFVRAHKESKTDEVSKAAAKVGDTNETTERLAGILKTRVILRRTAKGGKLIIDYKNDDDLDRIAQTIQG